MHFTSVILNTPQLEEQYNFYCGQLGLPVVEYESGFFSVDAGDTILGFTAATAPEPTPNHFAFNVFPPALQDLQAYLPSRNIKPIITDNILIHDFVNWNAKAIYFSDADNNIVECIARYNLFEPAPDQDFTPADICNISEVGIVADDLAGFIQIFQEQTGESTWKEYGPDFKAVGDEHGLLICVPPGRPWFPTTVPAKALPMILSLHEEIPPFKYGSYQFLPASQTMH